MSDHSDYVIVNFIAFFRKFGISRLNDLRS